MSVPDNEWSTTPKLGLHVPLEDGSTDLAYWCAIAYQMGLDVDGSFFLGTDIHKNADLGSAYPYGFTLMAVATDNGWPTANGTVLTMRRGDGAVIVQFFFAGGSSPAAYFRQGNTAGWNSGWLVVTGPASPSAMATGQITLVPPAGGGTVVGTVLFPAGRFTSPPRVALSAVTGTPGNVRVSLNATPTASQVQVALDRTDGAFGTSIQWTATQGVDT